MANKLIKNFSVFTISLMLVIFVFTFIGFNYSTYVYDTYTEKLEKYGDIYLDSIETIKYTYDYFWVGSSDFEIIKIPTTLYISFIVIAVFVSLQVVLVSSLLLRFKNKRVYILLKMLNLFITAIIITFVFVVLFNYINDISKVKKALENMTRGEQYYEIEEKFRITIATKTYISFALLFTVVIASAIATVSNNSCINSIIDKIFGGKKPVDLNENKFANRSEL
ncbi:hypothetical protein SCLARK_001217 [Spiroplasma clarkii]|uniref:Transmembrane protein n=1 Tax=Spiroplasma clarkii TaxID=2139 RepID=A0A1Y0L247_9MOLU|nr:hypothetical protein [Spiroplasma clarkii]ARU91769.1 hypothetical protein SCLARK_001217 [Spiroplasma clarkii]ATX71142.1 hypothetical protein SCLAR_v1c08340 [Spiroplasma clarkii]